MKLDPERLVIRGELHVTLQAVARCYQVQVSFLEEVYEHGLLGAGEEVEGQIALAASELDQVARIVRLYFHNGVDLPGIALFLANRT